MQPMAGPQGELREKPGDRAFWLSVRDPRSCQATIIKVADGYTVTVSLKEAGRTRMLAESTVDSYADAETVAQAFPSQDEFPGKGLWALEVICVVGPG